MWVGDTLLFSCTVASIGYIVLNLTKQMAPGPNCCDHMTKDKNVYVIIQE